MGARHFLRSPQLSSLHCHLKNLKLLGEFHQNAHVVPQGVFVQTNKAILVIILLTVRKLYNFIRP